MKDIDKLTVILMLLFPGENTSVFGMLLFSFGWYILTASLLHLWITKTRSEMLEKELKGEG
jgi:hypothetical protein